MAYGLKASSYNPLNINTDRTLLQLYKISLHNFHVHSRIYAIAYSGGIKGTWGTSVPPGGGSAPSPVRKQKYKNQPFLIKFWIFAPQKRILPPECPPPQKNSDAATDRLILLQLYKVSLHNFHVHSRIHAIV